MLFGILGPVEVRRPDGSPIDLGGPKTRALLAALLVDAGRVVSPDRLIDAVYGEAPPSGAANALQSQVSRLRRQLGADAVELHPGGYRLAAEPDDVDAHRFERLAGEGRRALEAGDHHGAERLLTEALQLWRGPALVSRLDELRLDATEDHIDARIALGQHREVLPQLRELIAEHPLRERLRILLVRALAGSGRQAEALVAFEDARRTLADELGADPSPELTEAHLAVLRGEQATSAPLPAQLTSFVGRDEELTSVGALLDQHRLVTLIGHGGTGKTRLAIEAAGRWHTAVCMVELAPLTDGDDVHQALLAALGIRESGTTSQPVDRLITALTDRSLLLLLDNCEHLIEPTAKLAGRLLAACPRLRVLATSREPLGITGEALCPVPRLKPAAAAQLFADRAIAVRPDFESDPDLVHRICQALDGMPLAIELAAARVRSLAVTEVAARLDDRFALLSKGSRTAEARHRTLRAVVEWSWDLLDARERELARRLTVFHGGATLADAERVCGLPDTVELMSSLVDKSLVEVSGDRYRMLETIRAFCAERLAEAGETDRLRRAHAENFLGLASTAAPELLGAQQLEWLARLDSDHDNLVAALRWATESDEMLALRLVSELCGYWWIRGRRMEGALLCRQLLTRLPPEPPAGLEEEYVMCVLSGVTGSQALQAHVDAVNAFTPHWDAPPRHPILTVIWSMAAGPPRQGHSTIHAQAVAVIGEDPWSQALMAMGEGFVGLFEGRTIEAEHRLSEGLSRFRAIGERWGMTQALAELAQLASWRDESERALALIDEAIELTEQLGATEESADMLCRRARFLLCKGDHEGAHADYERAAELARRAGALEMVAAAELGFSELARLRGDTGQARALCLRALDNCPKGAFNVEGLRSRLHVELARVEEAEGQLDEAVSWLRLALGDSHDHQLLAVAVEALAGVAAAAGNGELAARLLGAGIALRGTTVAFDPDIARVRATVNALIGAKLFKIAYSEGLRMSRLAALSELGA